MLPTCTSSAAQLSCRYAFPNLFSTGVYRVRDATVTDAEYSTWTSQEVCERLSMNRRAFHRMLAHVEQVFGFKALRIGTPNQHTALFKAPEVELLDRVFRFSERLGKFRGKYAAAALVVFGEMDEDGSLEHFETTERKLQRLRSQVAALESTVLENDHASDQGH